MGSLGDPCLEKLPNRFEATTHSVGPYTTSGEMLGTGRVGSQLLASTGSVITSCKIWDRVFKRG